MRFEHQKGQIWGSLQGEEREVALDLAGTNEAAGYAIVEPAGCLLVRVVVLGHIGRGTQHGPFRR